MKEKKSYRVKGWHAELDRYPVGEMGRGELSTTKCEACGATSGHYHAFGCALEPCPYCEHPLGACLCAHKDLTPLVKSRAKPSTQSPEEG